MIKYILHFVVLSKSGISMGPIQRFYFMDIYNFVFSKSLVFPIQLVLRYLIQRNPKSTHT